MKLLEHYAENPFESITAGRDRIARFFGDHYFRLRQAVENGEPFRELLDETNQRYTQLQKCHSDTRTSRTLLKSSTLNVDQTLDLFRQKILKSEALVLTHFDKNTPAYLEFFPKGRTAYQQMTKGNADSLFDQVILAFTHYADVLGPELPAEFTALKLQYDSVRGQQQGQKETRDDSGSSWDSAIAAMNEQAFINLLRIILIHMGHPERVNQYFDQSIVNEQNHSAADDLPASDQPPAQ